MGHDASGHAGLTWASRGDCHDIERGVPPEHTYRDSQGGHGLPVAASSARFLTPARYGDVLDVGVTVQACSEKSVTFGFRIGRRPEGKPVATGEITCVAIDANWHSIALPQE
ncbi:MAG TPA: thioesterase family protein [Candidatus Methylomirabilis sp.]